MPYTCKHVTDPHDPDVAGLHQVLARVFPNPDLLPDLEGLRRFIAEGPAPDLVFYYLVLKDGDSVIGGSIFRYMPGPNTGFSGYLALLPERHGQGLARMLVDERARLLTAAARAHGRPGVAGIFLDTENPDKLTPEEVAAERRHAVDPWKRRAIFRHFGFRTVDVRYTMMPVGPGRSPVTNLDLLCLPLDPEWVQRQAVPGDAVVQTLEPLWRRWDPEGYREWVAALAAEAAGRWLRLLP